MKRITLCILSFIAIGIVGYARYIAPSGGVLTSGGDYNSHILINEHLRTWDLFTEGEGKHSVSRFLPIYHGLVGFHLVSGFFEFIGVPLPGAYQLVMDMSFLCIICIFVTLLIRDIRSQELNLKHLIVGYLVFPVFAVYFCNSVDQAFYAQILCQALLVLAYYLEMSFVQKRVVYTIVAAAALCYPDFLLWLIPTFIVLGSKEFKILKVLAGVAWVGLAVVPFMRGGLPGPQPASLAPLVLVAIIFVFFFKELWRDNRFLFCIACFHLAYCLVLLLGTMKNGNLSYYGVKLSSFSYILAPALLLNIQLGWDNLRGKTIFTGIFAVFLFWSEVRPSSIYQLFGTRENLRTNAAYDEARRLKDWVESHGSCPAESTYVVPFSDRRESDFFVWQMNAVLKNFDLYSFRAKHSDLDVLYGGESFKGSMATFMSIGGQNQLDSGKVFIGRLRGRSLNQDLCLVIESKNINLFVEEQKFEILERRGEFVYVKVNSKSAR